MKIMENIKKESVWKRNAKKLSKKGRKLHLFLRATINVTTISNIKDLSKFLLKF